MATENSLVSVPERPPWQFKPGVSPNPGGRPKGIAALVREQTADGAELVEFMLDVLRGKRKGPLRLRMEAAAWLADRGFGKPVQQLDVGGVAGQPLAVRVEYADGAQDDGAGYPAA